VFNPEKVGIVMDELCEEISLKSICNEVCPGCPLSTNNNNAINNNVTLFNKELQ